MATKAFYLSEIDIDEEWAKLDPAGIDDISPDSHLGYKAGFADSAKILGISPEIELEITYRDLAKLASRMGYKKTLFQESPATYNGEMGNFQNLADQIVIAKLNYEWVKAAIDGNLSSKTIISDLKKIETTANKLYEQVRSFTKYNQLIKLRKLKSDKSFKELFLNTSTESTKGLTKKDTPDREYKNTAEQGDKYSGINIFSLFEELDQLEEFVEETKQLFNSDGGAPYKFSKIWLILEAAYIYEEWNVERYSAGISLDLKTGEPTGPFVRFMDQFFKAIDLKYRENSAHGIRNTGLASEASKVLGSIRNKNCIGIHRKLNPDIPISEFIPILKIFLSHRKN